MRTVEDAIRLKKRKLDEIEAQIKILEAAAEIMKGEEAVADSQSVFLGEAKDAPTSSVPPEKREVRRWP